MKRIKMRTVVAVCLALALMAGTLTIFSLAGETPDVLFVYDGSDSYFSIKGEKDGHEYPNLFGSATRNMMPGDTATKEITVGAKGLPAGSTVTIGLRSDRYNAYTKDGTTVNDISDAEYADYTRLLELMEKGLFTLTVEDGSIGQTWTAENLAAEDGVTTLVKLDSKRSEATLTLTLHMSEAVGNDFADLQAAIGWVFTAVCTTPTVTPVGPSLGDLTEDHYAYIIGYDDGLVHPEALITRAESVTIFFRMLKEESRKEYWSTDNPYYDVFPEHWYNNAISTMTRAGVVKGYPDGNFGATDNITRAEFAVMAVRFFAGKYDVEVTEDYFPDIEGHWANYEINLAYLYNLVLGTPEGNFEPDREITRAEAVTIVNRVLERYPDKDHLLEDMIEWPDNMDRDKWYYADVQEATNSHTYQLSGDRKKDSDVHEIWQTLLEVRDWAALEREWSQYNSSYSPGEVVSSRISLIN